MGLDFSFSLILESSQLDLLLLEIASCLSEKDARRLNNALPWQPALQREAVWGSGKAVSECQGIGGLNLGEFERQNDYCFSFLFPADAELEDYFGENYGRGGAVLEGGKIPIGCVWTKLYVGAEYALLTATAATSDMSRLFESSLSVRNLWVELAARSSSLALYFDSEDEYDWLLLHPEVRTVAKPYEDCFWSEDFKALNVDAYCWEALHLSRLPMDT